MIKFYESPNAACWDPVATSTPNIKNLNAIKSNHVEGPPITKSNDLLKALILGRNDPHNVPKNKAITRKSAKTKKTQKSKSNKFFDSPSSDDSDDEKCIKPRCNINIKNIQMSKSMLKNQKIEAESLNKPDTKVTENKTFTLNTRLRNKNKSKQEQIVPDCDVNNADELLNSSKDEIRQRNVPNKKNKNAVISDKSNSEICVTSIKNSLNENNNLKDLYNLPLSAVKLNNKHEKKAKKSVLIHAISDSKSSEQQVLETVSVSKEIAQPTDSQKAIILGKRAKSKENKEFENNSRILSPDLILDKKRNTSHQLFSNSLEQELIDSLDLTKTEAEEEKVNKDYHDNLKNTHLVTQKNCKNKTNISETNRRSTRAKKPFKEFWLPDNNIQGINVQSEGSVSSFKSIQQTLSKEACEAVIESKVKKVSSKIKRKRSRVDVTELKKDTNLVRKKKGKFSCQGNIPIPIQQNEKVETNIVQKKIEKKSEPAKAKKLEEEVITPDSTTPDVFKLLDQLPFSTGNPSDHCITECWSHKNFKCGVFKVEPSSEITYETAYSNSYFGGVLIQGRLRMKIGNQELELKIGDMAFVPPLTRWSAFNAYESESVFYYWSARLKASTKYN